MPYTGRLASCDSGRPAGWIPAAVSRSKKVTVPRNAPSNKKLSRRLFLRVSGAAGVVVGAAVIGRDMMSDPAARTVELPVQTTYLRRREDMLNLRISAVNLHVADISRPQLTKRLRDQPAYLVIDFGPQAAQERSFHASGAPGQAPVSLEWGGASRLAFDVSDRLPLPYTTDALLRWAGFAPRLVPNAQGRAAPDGFRGTPVPRPVTRRRWRCRSA